MRRILLAGIGLRLLCVILVVPSIHRDLFHPFLTYTWDNPSFDPWSEWLRSGGRSDAFPYGIALLATMIPMGAFGVAFATLVFGLFAIVIDTTLAKAIVHRSPRVETLILWAISPLAIFVTYLHGQTDIVLASLLCIAMFWLNEQKWRSAGCALALALAVKLSALLIVPFILVFLLDNPRYRPGARKFLTSLGVVGGLLQLPLLYSAGYRAMALRSPEGIRLLDYRVAIRDDYAILVLPLLYLGMLYGLWRLGRSTTKVLIAYATSAVFGLAVLTPGGVGWLIWVFPLLIALISTLNLRVLVMFAIFQVLVVVYFARVVSFGVLRIQNRAVDQISMTLSVHQEDLLRTLFIGLAFLIVASILRTANLTGDPFQIGQRPISFGIAGDSSTGKDTLSNAIAQIFPLEAPQMINGDDYHLYERGHSVWQRTTHLDPKANDLSRQSMDVQKMLRRDSVEIREYSHVNGRFSDLQTRRPADVVIVNGLHSLLLPPVRERFDAKIFLTMNETLRSQLKYGRDLAERSASIDQVRTEIERRRPDYLRFVEPQSESADLVMYVDGDHETARAETLNDDESTVLSVSSHDQQFLVKLADVLTSVALVRVASSEMTDKGATLTIWPGRLSKEENRWVLLTMVPLASELLDSDSIFQIGLTGLMSVIAVSWALNHRLDEQQ